MKLEIYSVYDGKASFYLQPVYMQSRGHAVRSFMDNANDKTHFLGKTPEDFTLFYLGTFDDIDGKFDLLNTPEPIGKAIQFVRPS